MRKRLLLLLGATMLGGCGAPDADLEDRMQGTVTHLNPEALHWNPAYSQVVVTSGPTRSIYIGGQNAVNPAGTLVGRGDMEAQSEQVARNLQVALGAAGAGVENLVKWNIYVVQGQPLEPAITGFQRVLGQLPNAPVITVVRVAGLAHPAYLLEVEAIAVVPE